MATFDSVNRNVIGQLVHHKGIPPKFFKLIQALHESLSGQVIDKGKLSQSFKISTGVCQGCLLSLMIFVIVVEWIMREVEAQSRKGIQWTLTTQLHDMDYVDGICLLSLKNNARIYEQSGTDIREDWPQ